MAKSSQPSDAKPVVENTDENKNDNKDDSAINEGGEGTGDNTPENENNNTPPENSGEELTPEQQAELDAKKAEEDAVEQADATSQETPEYLTKNLADTIKPRTSFVEGVPKCHVIEVGEPVTVPGEVVDGILTVSEDVVQKVYPAKSARPTYILLYPKGKRINAASVTKLN